MNENWTHDTHQPLVESIALTTLLSKIDFPYQTPNLNKLCSTEVSIPCYSYKNVFDKKGFCYLTQIMVHYLIIVSYQTTPGTKGFKETKF